MTTTTATSAATHTSRAVQLGQFLQQWQPRAFNWATANCCHFGAAWVQQVEGRQLMPALPANAGPMTARHYMLAHGGTLAAAISDALRRAPIDAAMAQVGDLVLTRSAYMPTGGTGYALGICAGRTAVHVDEAGASVHLPITGAVAAWRVGVPQ